MIYTVVVTAGCVQPNAASNNDSGNDIVNEILDMLNPTGKADPALENTSWQYKRPDETFVSLSFTIGGNIVNIFHGFFTVYTVKDSTVSFDSSKSVKIWSTITYDDYLKSSIAFQNKRIAELEDL